MNVRDLNRAIAERLSVRVTRESQGDEHIHGIPLAHSKEFWLLHDVREFHLDGYQIIPTREIAAVRFGKHERTFDRIYQAEGITEPVGIRYPLDLSSYPALFASLQATGKYVIVQTKRHIEKAKQGEKIFLIGPITDVCDKAVAVHCFDSCGKWDRKPVFARYDRISEIQFDSEYINVWSRHIGKPPANGRKASFA